MAMVVSSLRTTLFTPSLAKIPLDLLITAVTAPESEAHFDYQRLETLGDTVLKFTVGLQLLAEYPHWHEGYLSRKKDHSVSNARLAKEAHAKCLYRWIIRMRFPAQKWKPEYTTSPMKETRVQQGTTDIDGKETTGENQQLSTKMLADVVESLIGAAYLHGGFDLAVECCQLFGLGLAWDRILCRVQTILSRVESTDNLPTQTTAVEQILGYKFQR
jgi:dsRNA-specific ribonuclease